MKKAKIKIQCFSEITKTTGTFLVDLQGEQLTPTYADFYEFLQNIKDLFPNYTSYDFRHVLIDDLPLIPLKEINQKFIHLTTNL